MSVRVPRRTFLAACAGGLALLARRAGAALRLCPSCGYEQEEGATTCSHCGKPLSGAAPAPAAPAEAAAAPTATRVDAALVASWLGLARQDLAAERYALALMEARQGLALARLAPGAEADLEAVGEEIGRALRLAEQPCPACQGQGRGQLLNINMRGEVQKQTAPNLRCPVCGGSGRLRRIASKQEVQDACIRAQRHLENRMQKDRYELSGGVWLPEGVATTLTARQLAAARSTQTACPDCQGFGRYGCESCKGAGRLACTQNGCVMGKVLCPDCQGARRATVNEDGRARQVGCTTCRQVGIADCSACRGRGYEECSRCTGRGDLLCTTCKGSGQRALCTKCEGRGVTDCRNCKGIGQYRGAPCMTCRGQKEMLCTSCNGSGRKAR